MVNFAGKHETAIEDATLRLLGRAVANRGLIISDVKPRVILALEKYLFRDGAQPERSEVSAFIDEIRADDLCLIIACERGDEQAWEDLVAGFDQTVKSAARKISSNNEDAEDLASSIWAELYGLRQDADGTRKSKLGYYSGRGSLAGWLRAVVSQLAIDQFRKQSKLVQVEEASELERLVEDSSSRSANEAVLHHIESPEELYGENEASADVTAALRRAVGELADEDRLILKLYYFEDLKLKDIANTFGYHEATASRKLARLHSEIRKSVEKELKRSHGWSDSEVKRFLSETAAKLGFSLEKMFAVLIALAAVQDLWF